MRVAKIYYNDILLGTLWENGKFNYELYSSYADRMNMELIIHDLERIRQIGLEKDFNFNNYTNSWLNFPFKDSWSMELCDSSLI